MNYKIVFWIVLLGFVFSVGLVFAADKSAKASTEAPGEGVAKAAAAETSPAPPAAASVAPGPENTVDACRDGIDNDGNGLIDCADPECQIFAICVGYEPETTPPPEPGWKPETGRQCSDGLDNNEDGLIDCHEVSCQRYRYCRNLMYEIPEPKKQGARVLYELWARCGPSQFPHANCGSRRR